MDVYGLVDEARDRKCDAVIYGHTHKPYVANIDKILVVNPGSLAYPRQDGRVPSYAVMDVEEGKDFSVEIRYL